MMKRPHSYAGSRARAPAVALSAGLLIALGACTSNSKAPAGGAGSASGAGGAGAGAGSAASTTGSGSGGYAPDPPEVIHNFTQPDCSKAAALAVPVGDGSYADCPPKGVISDPKLDALVQSMATNWPIAVEDKTRAIPTNHWWTSLLVNNGGGQVWAYPLVVRTQSYGVDVASMAGWNTADPNGFSASLKGSLQIKGDTFTPAGPVVRDWSDWLVEFVLADQAKGKSMVVTTGHGLPFVWLELTNVSPVVNMAADFSTFDDAGNPAPLPATGDHLGLSYDGRFYGLFAPSGATFTRTGNALSIGLPSVQKGFLAIAELTAAADLSFYHQYAYAIPRSTEVTWKFSPEASVVQTTWALKTENLKGEANLDVLQGFLPHTYNKTTPGFTFDKRTYFTPRGTMKTAVGHSFDITFPFHGFVPELPAPEAVSAPNPYDPDRMKQQVEAYAAKPFAYGNDTYWGGKDLLQYAKYMHFAHEIGDTAAFDTLKQNLRTALEDWYTYTPGEKAHYFALYYNWKALVGFSTAYGSEQFTDQHFHYGYHIYATAVLGMYDQDFLKKYGDMATLVAKEYANYNRDDPNFPLFRTFDPWFGHSNAGGFSDPTSGNNQESSSEALQSWSGLFLLGSALGNDRMRNAGAFGYALEAAGSSEYWFDRSHQNFPPEWTHGIATVVRDDHMGYWTYFSGDPIWKHAILWLPMSPGLNCLVEDYDYAKKEYAGVMKDMAPQTEADWNSGLGNVALSYAQLFDPDYVAKRFDDLWAANSDVVHAVDTGGITYFYTHSNRRLGRIAWDYHTSIPTSTVYYNQALGEYSYVVYNPTGADQTCNVYQGNTLKDTFLAPKLTLFTKHVKAN